MKKIVITGATSFIGLSLIKNLIRKNVEIFAVVRPGTTKTELFPNSNKIFIVQSDMDDYNKLDGYIHDSCDCMIHLAWDGTRGVDRTNGCMQRKNYLCAMDAVHTAARLGCSTFISAGSQAEYGPHNCSINEETVCNPNTEYGKYKLRFYEYACEFCKNNGMHFKEPRFFSLYGPGDFSGTMIISTLVKMLLNEDCDFTESKQMWDFLYIEDAVNGVVKLIETDCSDGAYNFGSGNARPLMEFINDMYRLTGSKSKLNFGRIPYPETGMVSIQPGVDKLKRETGWHPETTFEDGIKKILKSIECEGYDENNQHLDTDV